MSSDKTAGKSSLSLGSGDNLAHAFVDRAHRAADYILCIHHCSECTQGDICPYNKKCAATKVIVAHTTTCTLSVCNYPGCTSTKALLAHIEECKIYKNGMRGVDTSSSPTFCLMCSLILKKRNEGDDMTGVSPAPAVPVSRHIITNRKPFGAVATPSVPRKRWLALADEQVDSSPLPTGVSESDEYEEEGTEGDEGSGLDDSVHFRAPMLPKRFRSETIWNT